MSINWAKKTGANESGGKKDEQGIIYGVNHFMIDKTEDSQLPQDMPGNKHQVIKIEEYWR